MTVGWRDIFRELWSARLFVVLVTAIGMLGGGIYAITATKWFRSEVLMVPSSSDSSRALPGNLSAIGGLIGLSGLGTNKPNTTEAIALLGSGDFLGAFVEDQNLLPTLFSEEWDEQREEWSEQDPSRQPDVWDGVKFVEDNILFVSEDPQTGLVRLAVEWKDPVVAAEWANALVERVNDQMRVRALAEANANIEYLESQLLENSVAPIRSSISSLLEAEHEKVMLANGNSQFVFRIIDSAKAPKRPVRPRLVMTVAVTTFFSFCVAAFIVLARATLRSDRPD